MTSMMLFLLKWIGLVALLDCCRFVIVVDSATSSSSVITTTTTTTAVVSTTTTTTIPKTPIIGILSQPLLHDTNSTYISASYVKWIEAGGGRSIPIPYDANTTLVKDILRQVDGVLFPGGATDFVPSSAIDIWHTLHTEYYPRKNMIPLWGTCLGLEYILQLATENYTILETGYNATNISLSLLDVNNNNSIRMSELYRPRHIYDIVTNYNVTMNNHHLGISPERFQQQSKLKNRWMITSQNYDLNGKSFVSTIEPIHKEINPIYGVQYHPEKNAFEYGLYPNTNIPYEAINHSREGIQLSLYLSDFFVNLARNNMLKQQQQQQSNTGQNNNNEHDNKQQKLYPMVYTYPRRVGYKFFEEIYIIRPTTEYEMNQQDVLDGPAIGKKNADNKQYTSSTTNHLRKRIF